MQWRTDFNGRLAKSDAEAANQIGFKMSNEMDCPLVNFLESEEKKQE